MLGIGPQLNAALLIWLKYPQITLFSFSMLCPLIYPWYSGLQLITIWKSKLWNSELSRNPISDWQLLDKLVQHEHKWELKLGLIYLTKPKEEVNNWNQHLDNYMLLLCGKQTELLFSFSASEDFKSVSYQSMVIKELSLFYWCS